MCIVYSIRYFGFCNLLHVSGNRLFVYSFTRADTHATHSDASTAAAAWPESAFAAVCTVFRLAAPGLVACFIQAPLRAPTLRCAVLRRASFDLAVCGFEWKTTHIKTKLARRRDTPHARMHKNRTRHTRMQCFLGFGGRFVYTKPHATRKDAILSWSLV